jgi:hypothetical protein
MLGHTQYCHREAMYRIYVRTKIKDQPQKFELENESGYYNRLNKRAFKAIGWYCGHCKKIEEDKHNIEEIFDIKNTS